LVYWFVRLVIPILKILNFQISFENVGLFTSNTGVDKNKIEAIDSKEMIRIENLGTRLPHGCIYTLFSC